MAPLDERSFPAHDNASRTIEQSRGDHLFCASWAECRGGEQASAPALAIADCSTQSDFSQVPIPSDTVGPEQTDQPRPWDIAGHQEIRPLHRSGPLDHRPSRHGQSQCRAHQPIASASGACQRRCFQDSSVTSRALAGSCSNCTASAALNARSSASRFNSSLVEKLR